MYLVIVYDVSVERVNSVCKYLRQYLNWVQNSVFEGEVSESKLMEIKDQLKKLIYPRRDSVIIYIFQDKKYIKRKQMGVKKGRRSNIV